MVLELSGGIAELGEYYAVVWLGGEKARLQADTGSSSLIVTAKECKTCGPHGGAYSLSGSPSGRLVACSAAECGANTCSAFNCRSDVCSAESGACCSAGGDAGAAPACGFFLQYGGDTDYHVGARGDLVLEALDVAGRTFSNVTIYRTLEQVGPWPSSVDGILGLGLPRLNCNPTCATPVYESVLVQSGLPAQFSLCLGDLRGALVLGSDGVEEGLHAGKVHYVPFMSNARFGTYYTVGIEGLLVDAVPLERPRDAGAAPWPRQAIVDSGTTLLLLENDLFAALKAFFQTRFCRLPGVCGAQSVFEQGVCLTELPRGFPTISLSLSGAALRLELPPSVYFVAYRDPALGHSVYCLGIQPAGHERTVLGDTLLRGFSTVFDLDRRRIGFARPNRTRCGPVATAALMHGDAQGGASGGGNVRPHRAPASLTASSSTSQAVALALGSLAVFAAGLAQLLVCTRASSGLQPNRRQDPASDDPEQRRVERLQQRQRSLRRAPTTGMPTTQDLRASYGTF